MGKTFRLMVALAIVTTAFTACKTKQKITEVPAGANIQASTSSTKETEEAPAITSTTTSSASSATKTQSYTSEPQKTTNETFSYVEGDSEAMKYKFHVVVGSFSKQENAQNLQAKLKADGNKSLIVVNEKGMYRVLIASFNDYNEAHSLIKKIANTYTGSWVLVQK